MSGENGVSLSVGISMDLERGIFKLITIKGKSAVVLLT